MKIITAKSKIFSLERVYCRRELQKKDTPSNIDKTNEHYESEISLWPHISLPGRTSTQTSADITLI